ncbi:MAG TPA: sigma-70 family RNA polymerase sigma factor [Solirubrobacterales bacterium]|nr:sigma-70 family RNA polymerase sigma factor [Solirubrobacterales bacterium]
MAEGESRPPTSRARQFETIFNACYRRVLGYAIRRTGGDRAAAEDAVSETFLIAWRRLDAIPPDPLPWLLATARKVLANQRRTARRHSPDGPTIPLEAVADPAPGASVADRVADRQAFAEAFDSLSAGDREVLALVSWDGLAPREAAAVLGCSAATFSLRLHRARRRLLKRMAASGHSFGDRADDSLEDHRPGSKEAR